MEWKSKFNSMAPKKQQLLIMMLVGIILVVIAFPAKEEKKQKETDGSQEQAGGNSVAGYEEEMERKLTRMLERIAGVGKVKVMITLKSTSEKIVEKDEEKADTTFRETTVYGDADTSSVPYVKKEMTPEVGGVVVAAQGGGNPVAVQQITEAVQALFDVDTHKIKVMKMNQTK